jgi:hypothetical protein
VHIRVYDAVDWEMRRNGENFVRQERIYICSLVRKQDKGNVLSTAKMCTFSSLRLLMCMAEASLSRMTQHLRHNLEGGSSLHITYIGLSPAYKRAFPALRMLISKFPLFAFGAAADLRSRDRRGCR